MKLWISIWRMKEDRRSLLKNSIIPSMVDSIVLWSYMISLWKITSRPSGLTERSTMICPSDTLQRHVHCIFSVFTDGATSNNLFQYCLFIFWSSSDSELKACFQNVAFILYSSLDWTWTGPDGCPVQVCECAVSRKGFRAGIWKFMVSPSSSQDVKYI